MSTLKTRPMSFKVGPERIYAQSFLTKSTRNFLTRPGRTKDWRGEEGSKSKNRDRERERRRVPRNSIFPNLCRIFSARWRQVPPLLVAASFERRRRPGRQPRRRPGRRGRRERGHRPRRERRRQRSKEKRERDLERIARELTPEFNSLR